MVDSLQSSFLHFVPTLSNSYNIDLYKPKVIEGKGNSSSTTFYQKTVLAQPFALMIAKVICKWLKEIDLGKSSGVKVTELNTQPNYWILKPYLLNLIIAT